jgi:transcriptional regulator with XRE-family HTH domain
LRAVRLHKRLRQIDVALAAGVSQSVVSRAENDQLRRVSVREIDRVAQVLDVSLVIDAKWNGGNVDRLIDRAHASIVEYVVKHLRELGWEVIVEYGFNHYGDRGSVDVLAWHPGTRTLLIVEVKSILTDLQATFTSFATKVRVVPALVRREFGWNAAHVGRLLVMPGSTANRSVVTNHVATFETLFPRRMPSLRTWLRKPDGPVAGVWFLATSPGGTRTNVRRVRQRGAERGPRSTRPR